MLNVMNVADTLVDHIKAHYPQEVAIVAYYGSYAQGTATERSDLDFYFIPASSKGYQASIQFVLQDISFDFWPISWERAERMAAYQESKTSVIAESVLLYSRSDEDLARFRSLQQTINDLPKNQELFLDRAEEQLQHAYVHLYKLTKANPGENISYYHLAASDVLIHVLSCLALLNRSFFKSGWGKNINQILNFTLKPPLLKEQIDSIIQADTPGSIRAACEHLTESMLSLWMKEKAALAKPPSYAERMNGFFEEIKGVLDKLKTACVAGDYQIAYFNSLGVQEEIARFMYYAVRGYWPTSLETNLDYQRFYVSTGMPDLVSVLDPHDFAPLHEAVIQLESSLGKYLLDQGVTINRYESLEQLKSSLEQSLEDTE